jgi:hypothetical protein
MVTTLVLATLLAGQGKPSIPANTILVTSGIPSVVGKASPDVKMTRHHVFSQLTKDTISFSSVTTLSNSSDKPVSLTLRLPEIKYRPEMNGKQSIDFKATWDNKPVKVGYVAVASSDSQSTASATKVVIVKLVPKGNQVLRVEYSVPIGKAGLDGMERIVAYETRGASSWPAPVGVFSWSLKYNQSIVFQKIEANPASVWQTGDRGAYYEEKGFTPNANGMIWFRFYPGDYDKIGN